MANEVKFTLAMAGGTAIANDLDRVGGKLVDLNTKVKDATGAADAFGRSAKTVGNSLGDFGQKVGSSRDLVGSLSQGLRSAFIGSGVAVGLIGLVNGVKEFTRAMVQAQIQADQLRNGLNFAVGRNKAAGELNFIRESSRALGLEFVSTSQEYMKLAAAARGTSLEGQKVRDIFTAVASASTVMGLSAEQTSGALLSIGQMISKNTVMSEELKGQLGERLPGAFQIAARAMNVTTEEFNKMLETGQVLAGDFLPKFARELSQNVAPEVDAASKSMQASINRLSNAWTDLKQTLSQSGVSTVIGNDARIIAQYMEAIRDSIDNAKKSGAGMAMQLSTGLGTAMIRGTFGLAADSVNLLNGSVNTLSMGVLKFRSDYDFLPAYFTTNAQKAEALGGKLQEAEGKLAGLQRQMAATPNNVYLKNETFQTYLFVQQLRAAKTAQDNLKQSQGLSLTQQGVIANGQGREEYERQRAATIKGYQGVAQELSGVNANFNTHLAQLKAGFDAGYVSQAQYVKDVEALIKKEGGVRKEGAGIGAQAVKAAESQYDGLLLRVRERIELYAEELSQGRLLTDAEKQTAKLSELLASNKSKLNAAQRAAIEGALLEAKAKEVLVLAQRSNLEAAKEFEALRDREIAGQEASILKMEEKALAMEDEVRMYGLGKEAIEALSIARLQERIDILAGFEGSAAQILLLEKEIDARRRLALATDAKSGLDAGVKAAKEADAEWKKTADSINTTLTDALMRAFEGGKSFAQAARDTIVNMFKTMVLRPIISAVMSPASAVIGGALGMNGAANAATSGSGIMSSLSNLSTLSTLGNMISTGVAGAVGSSVSAIFGTMAGNAAIGTTLGLGASSSLAAASAASVAGGGAAAGAGLTSVTTALAGIGPVGWAAIAAIAVAGIFGGRGKKEATGGGIEGNFSGAGFAGNNFSTWKQDGGWFRSDRTGKDTSALDAATAKQFTDAYGAVQQSAAQAAGALGLSADAITSYSQDISLQLGTDAAANEKAVAALFSGIGDNMALAAAPGIALLSKEGEAAGETMARLSTSITTANAWLSILRQRLFQVSLAGGDAASKLADAFGGLENLSAASKSFYETYYTEGERAARSQEDMAKALALVNLAMPTTKDGLRELAGSLDLNTEAGRTAYAVLLAIAPEFAVAADLAAKFSQEMAAKLVKTFTGGGQLVPALDVAALKTVLLADTLISTYEVAGSISVLFLDVNSGLLTFGARTGTLTGGLTGAQLAALALTGQIDALHQGADRTRIDFVGLSAALEGVDTETFANTVALVFDSLASRISGVIDGIGAERIAVREAALQIINPTVMGKDAITRAIGAINVNTPNNAALVAAQQALGRADANVGTQNSAVDYARSLAPSRAALDAAGGTLGAANTRINNANAGLEFWRTTEGGKFRNNVARAFVGDFEDWRVPWAGEVLAGNAVREYLAAESAQQQAQAAYATQTATYNNAVAANAAQIATAQASLSAAAAAQAAAVTAARTAQTAYIASLQDFSIDASKAVGKLGKLREETVKYYDAQKQLADLMGTSAAGLRTTVADYRYSQLTDAQQFDKLQSDFAKNYAMGLSTSGETLAGYGDKLNAGLNPLLEKAKEVLTGSAYDAFAATALARAEAIAGRLETLTPTNYAADSLAMLGQIDATLAVLDASSKSAEKIISDAVTAGADKMANGLRAVIAALTGQSIPAFAAGGAYQGGLALVGERGPEFINFNQPGQVYTAQQTRGMFAGGNSNTARLEALVERQSQQLEGLRAELRAIATSSKKLVDYADRVDVIGMGVRNQGDAPLQVQAVTA